MHTDSESDGSPTDMTFFNMAPICPLDPTNPFYCLQGNYADWVSDFLETSGQERLRQDDARLTADDYAMPDWCFLDDANPDWDDLCRQWNKSDYTQFDANINWEISDRLSFLSTTGISDFSSSGVSDWQLMGMEFRPSGVESEVLYQEFQFNLNFLDGKIDLITGVNYFNEDSGSPRESLINAFGSSNYANNATGGAANGNLWGCNDTLGVPCAGTVRRLRTTGDGSVTQESTAYGLFANSTIHFTERLNLTLGVRESHDEKALVSELFASDNFIPQFGGSTIVSAEDDWSATDYRVTLDFKITDDFMIYGTSSKAFRSGSFTVPGPVLVNAARAGDAVPCPAAAGPRAARDAAQQRDRLSLGVVRRTVALQRHVLRDGVHGPARRLGRRRRVDHDGLQDRSREPGRRRPLGLRDRGDVRGHGAVHDRGRHGARQFRDVEPLHQQRPVPVPAADGSASTR